MSLMADWWRRLQRRFRDLRDERPFMLVRISDSAFQVETFEKALIPGQYEQTPSQQEGLLRYVYRPRGVTVDISAACE